MEDNSTDHSPTNWIDVKSITMVFKGAQSKVTDTNQTLIEFDELLSKCNKEGDKLLVDTLLENKMKHLYVKLPWTEQLKLKMSKYMFILPYFF